MSSSPRIPSAPAFRAVSAAALIALLFLGTAAATPRPLLSPAHPVDSWFGFTFSAWPFLACKGSPTRVCIYGTNNQYAGADTDVVKLDQMSDTG